MLPVKYSRADYEAALELFIWSNIFGTFGVVVSRISRWQRYLLPLFTFTSLLLATREELREPRRGEIKDGTYVMRG